MRGPSSQQLTLKWFCTFNFCLKILQKVLLPFNLLYDLKNDYNNDEDDEVEDGYFNIKSFIKLFLETK